MDLSWFESLFGFEESSPDTVRDQLRVEGTQIHSLANGRSFEAGRLETPSLAEERAAAATARGKRPSTVDDEVRETALKILRRVATLHGERFVPWALAFNEAVERLAPEKGRVFDPKNIDAVLPVETFSYRAREKRLRRASTTSGSCNARRELSRR